MVATQIKTSDIHRQVTPSGQVNFDGADAEEILLRGFDLSQFCFSATAAIGRHNAVCERQDKIPLITRLTPDSVTGEQRVQTWKLIEPYGDLAIRPLLIKRCERVDEIARVHQEMDVYEALALEPVLRLMVMLVDHWRARRVVWGVGRGSSVASYVLFLIGVHRIDSLAYDLSFHEFLRL